MLFDLMKKLAAILHEANRKLFSFRVTNGNQSQNVLSIRGSWS
jgi:hypothetical protein